MVGTLAIAVDAALTAAFSAANTAVGAGSPNRISVYRAMIPGVPTNRYAVVYGSVSRGTSSLNGVGRDGNVRFQVTCAATAPDTNRAADACDWLVNTAMNALVGAQLSVDGWAPFIVEQDTEGFDTFPIPVEVVPGRDTVEQALRFQSLTDRITTP